MPIIEEAARQNHANLVRDGIEAEVVTRIPAVGGQVATLRTPNGTYAEVPIAKFGEHQAHNALAALCAAEVVIPVNGALDGDLVAEHGEDSRPHRADSHIANDHSGWRA